METEKVETQATPAAEEAPKKAKKEKKVVEGPVCKVCGKPLKGDEAIQAGIGAICSHRPTPEAIAEAKAKMTVDAVPEGYIKLAEAAKFLQQLEIPVARLVRATGGDRALNPPIRPEFQVVYHGNARYLNPWVLSEEGIKVLSDSGLGQPKPEKPAKAEKPEGEKKGKKGKKAEVAAVKEDQPRPEPVAAQ